jgi:hypothetical protein
MNVEVCHYLTVASWPRILLAMSIGDVALDLDFQRVYLTLGFHSQAF